MPQVHRKTRIKRAARERPSASSSIAKSILSRLSANKIIVPAPKEVQQYLISHPQLAKLVPHICGRVRRGFGNAVELSLQLYRDPEIDDPYLSLYVRRENYGPGIMDEIEAVCLEFNHKLEQVPGYLLVTTDFRRPGGKNAV